MIEFIYLAMIEIWLVGILGFHRVEERSERREKRPAASTFRVSVVAGTLAAAFIGQLQIIARASVTQVPFPARYTRLPLTPIDDSVPLFGHTPYWVTSSILLLAMLECVALTLLYRLLRGKRLSTGGIAVVALGGATMIGSSLATHAVTTTDLYFYVGLGHLGSAAYSPPITPFPGEFSAINRVWGDPMLPSPYGPLWTRGSEIIVRTSEHLAGQLEAFRVVGLLGFLACIALLVKLRATPASIALFSLNPALIEQYVANGHNDIVAVAFCMAALSVARRRPLLAAILGATAGAIKLPFVLVSTLAFSRSEKPAAVRIGLSILTCALAVAVTFAGTGGRYFAAATAVATEYRSALGLPIHSVIIGLALVSILTAILWKRFIPTASWSMISLTPAIFPGYVVLALPYAVLEEALLPVYLAALPLVAFCFATVYGMTTARHYVYALFITVVPVLLMPILLVLRKNGVGGPDYAGT